MSRESMGISERDRREIMYRVSAIFGLICGPATIVAFGLGIGGRGIPAEEVALYTAFLAFLYGEIKYRRLKAIREETKEAFLRACRTKKPTTNEVLLWCLGGVLGARVSRAFNVVDIGAIVFIGLGGGLLNLVYYFMTRARGTPEAAPKVRGTQVTELPSSVDGDRRSGQLASAKGPHAHPLFWGGSWLPESVAEGHFCVVGTTGSGKTLTLRHLMQCVLPQVGTRPDLRALVYDAKRDALSTLGGMGMQAPTFILNPFDARCSAWDIAKDVTTPATALQVASILIPEEEGSQNRYFSDAARDILSGVLKAFIQIAPGRWTFRDVVCATKQEAHLRRILLATPSTTDLIDQYFKEPRTFSSIRSTIASRMGNFEAIAALWAKATHAVSLQEWVTSSSVLVLGNEESLRAPLDAVNRVLFQRITELLLNQSESSSRRTWVFLDEVKEAGRLDGLSRLLTSGRSKGVRVAIGFQDIEGLRHVYGDKLANELVGMCANKALLRIESNVTAKWASDVVGESLRSEYTTSVTESEQGTSETYVEHVVKREAVLASEFMRMAPPDATEFPGYYISPSLGVYRSKVRFREGLQGRGAEADFQARPSEDQYLVRWSEEDLSRLSLLGLPGSERPPSSPLDGLERIE